MQNTDNRRITLLASGPVGKALFAMSAPAIAGMVVMAVYNIVDTIFVSMLRDTTAIAATGIVFPLFQLIGAVGLTFGMGAASVISRRLGENDHAAAERAASTALVTSALIGLALSFFGAIFIVPILRLFGATDAILASATLYGRVILGGSIFQVVNMTVNNILRAEGASGHSSIGQMIGAVLNIILDPIFIFGLNMGVTGAAVATVIAQAVSTIFLLGFYLARKGVLHPLRPSNFHPTRATYGALMVLGLPTFVRQILGSVSFGVLNNAAGAYGESAIAAISLTLRIFMLLFMAMIGLAQGLQPVVGYNYGARAIDRVRATLRLVFVTAATIGLVAGLAGFVFAPGIMRLFAPQDPAVVEMGSFAMRAMAVTLVPIALVIMFGGVFQAIGDGRSAMLLAAGQQGLFMIPLVIILPRVLGLNGVFLAQPAGFTLAFVVGLVLMLRTERTKLRADVQPAIGT